MKKKRVLALLLATTLALGCVGCQSSGSDGGETSTATTEAGDASGTTESGGAVVVSPGSYTLGDVEPITMQLCYWGSEVPTESNSQVLEYVEEAVGIAINPTWVPPGSMTEKTTTTIVSADLPEVMQVVNSELRMELMEQAIAGGMFYDLTEAIKSYDNLMTLPENIMMGTTYGGSIYGIPRTIIFRNGGLLIRQDWLENTGLDLPTTLAEYEEMFRVFTEEDPDGNGVDDTQGIILTQNLYFAPLMLASGCAPSWWINQETNEVLPMYLSDGYMDYLNFMKGIYDAGYTNADFAATTQQEATAMFNEEKGGSYPDTIGRIAGGSTFEPLYTNNSEAKIVASCETEMPDGTLATKGSAGFYGAYFIDGNVSEERLHEILYFFNELMSDDVVFMLGQGVEGVHYTWDDEFEWICDDSGLTLFSQQTAATGSITVLNSFLNRTKLGMVDNSDLYYEYQTREGLLEFPDITGWFTSCSEVVPVQDIVDMAATKYVMGQCSEQDVLDAIDRWLAGGGQANIDQWTAQYANMISQ